MYIKDPDTYDINYETNHKAFGIQISAVAILTLGLMLFGMMYFINNPVGQTVSGIVSDIEDSRVRVEYIDNKTKKFVYVNPTKIVYNIGDNVDVVIPNANWIPAKIV